MYQHCRRRSLRSRPRIPNRHRVPKSLQGSPRRIPVSPRKLFTNGRWRSFPRRRELVIGLEKTAHNARVLSRESVLTGDPVDVLSYAPERERGAHVMRDLLRQINVLQHQLAGESVFEVVRRGHLLHYPLDWAVRLGRPVLAGTVIQNVNEQFRLQAEPEKSNGTR